jgi:hypothetical protein
VIGLGVLRARRAEPELTKLFETELASSSRRSGISTILAPRRRPEGHSRRHRAAADRGAVSALSPFPAMHDEQPSH